MVQVLCPSVNCNSFMGCFVFRGHMNDLTQICVFMLWRDAKKLNTIHKTRNKYEILFFGYYK